MIKEFIITNLMNIHTGTASQKILGTIKLAAAPAIGISLTERFIGWYIENQIFMSFVFVALSLDHILGSWVHYRKGDFSLKENIYGLFGKTTSVIVGYVLFEMVHQIVKDVDFIAIYFKVLLQLMVLLYPAGSAMGNLSILTNGKFPPVGWMKKLRKFNEEADLETFKTKKYEE